MMRCTGATAMTTTAIGCEWSFHAAAGVRGAASAGLAGRPGADTGLHPDDQSTGSLCRVSMTINQSLHQSTNKHDLFFSFFELKKIFKRKNLNFFFKLLTFLQKLYVDECKPGESIGNEVSHSACGQNVKLYEDTSFFIYNG